MIFTLVDGSILVLASNAKYEIISRYMPVQGGSPSQEIRRLEAMQEALKKAMEKLQ